MAEKNARGPLDGLKVLDMTEHMAGPYCTMILADMGADVIKVERPGAGDSSRAMGDGSERNPYFRYINRNKKSLTLDYKAPRGKEIFLKLVTGMDVLVENYRPTVMDRAGLGYDDAPRGEPAPHLRPALRLRLRRPLPRAGRLRPDRPGHGRDHARHGRARRSADLRRPAHLRPRHRHVGSPGRPRRALRAAAHGPGAEDRVLAPRDGRGLFLMDERGLAGRSQGADAPGLAPPTERALPALRDQGRLHDDRRGRPGHLGARAKALGHPEWLDDPRFRRGADRMRNRAVLEAGAVRPSWRPRRPRTGARCWTTRACPAGPCTPTRSSSPIRRSSIASSWSTPRTRSSAACRTSARPCGCPRAMSAVRATAPKLGQHTDQILAGLGYAPDDIAALRRDRVI